MKSNLVGSGLRVALTGIAILGIVTSAPGEEPRTVMVIGTGTASAPPTYGIVRGRINGTGESAEELFKSFEEMKTKVEKGFSDDAPGVTVRFQGESIAQSSATEFAALADGPTDFGGERMALPLVISAAVELGIEFSSEMERVQATRKLAELLDRARELGVTFREMSNPYEFSMMGGRSAVTEFGLADPAAVRKQALQAALEDARSQAEALAGFSGGKVGKVISLEELDSSSNDPQSLVEAMISISRFQQKGPGEFASTANEPIVAERKLRVVFELLDG